MANYPKGRRGYHGIRKHSPRKAFAPTLHPTSQDIAWAAGIIEGEGSVCKAKKCHFGQGIKLSVVQKDVWLLNRLRDLFGGSVGSNFQNEDSYTGKPVRLPVWRISGVRCFGLLMTIYKFMSPRRQEQFKIAWGERS